MWKHQEVKSSDGQGVASEEEWQARTNHGLGAMNEK